MIHQVELHPNKVNHCCGFLAGSVIGPLFFKNNVGEAITVNGERYRRMITYFIRPKKEVIGVNLDDMWFQQNSTASRTVDVRRTFRTNDIQVWFLSQR